MTGSLLHCSALHGRRGKLTVFADVTFSLNKGERVAVCGRSGAGKSTLLDCVAGLLPATKGTVSGVCRKAYMAQEGSLLPWLTVEENIRLYSDVSHSGVDVAAALTAVGLGGRGGSFPHELSGGQRQRASLAAVLCVRPELVLLDEPFSAQDYLTRQEMNILLDQVVSECGAAILLVTHNIREAISLCSRLLVMSGTPAQLVADISVDPGDPFLEKTVIKLIGGEA